MNGKFQFETYSILYQKSYLINFIAVFSSCIITRDQLKTTQIIFHFTQFSYWPKIKHRTQSKYRLGRVEKRDLGHSEYKTNSNKTKLDAVETEFESSTTEFNVNRSKKNKSKTKDMSTNCVIFLNSQRK